PVVVALGARRDDEVGLAASSRGGAYVGLRARGGVVGVLALEWRGRPPASPGPAEVLEGVREHAALALDNARWFARLRMLGASERAHIAHDLHDNLGQSLAYLGIELERLGRRTSDGALQAEITRLRETVRGVIGDLRDTLHDLRTDVSAEVDLPATLSTVALRLHERSGLQVTVDNQAERRLALLREREVWRIAYEALVNATRHSAASSVNVSWRCDASGFELDVDDDGAGFDPDSLAAVRKGGLAAMRARADAIGARLEVHSRPGAGTRVVCSGAAA
ncbi:MAG TPA: histidine kinase, partial [Acidimicrobiales bacterium]